MKLSKREKTMLIELYHCIGWKLVYERYSTKKELNDINKLISKGLACRIIEKPLSWLTDIRFEPTEYGKELAREIIHNLMVKEHDKINKRLEVYI